MVFNELIRPDRINLSLNAATQEEALLKLAGLLEATGVLTDKAEFLADVRKRELVSSTGIGNGVAIPHGKSTSVKETGLAIGRVKNGLDWETFDDIPVRLVVLLAVSDKDKSSNHVRLLSQMARKLASEAVCQKLHEANSADEIVQILSA